MGAKKMKADPMAIPKGYTVVNGPDKKTQYIVPDFVLLSLEQKLAGDRAKSSIKVPSGLWLYPQAKALPTYVTFGGMLHTPSDPPLSSQELLILHGKVQGLQQQLGICYRNASHRLYMAEMEKLIAADAMQKAMERLDRKISKSLKGLADRHNVDSKAAALDNYTGISGSHALFCPLELIAKAHFYSVLERGEVVEVVPLVCTVLNHEDVSICTGFRPEDPSTPEIGTWTLVIVGWDPGIFSLVYRPQGSIVHLNIQGICGSQTKALPTRTDAVNKFLQLVDAGEVVRVSSDSNLRIAHTPEMYLELCRYCQNM
ncbi:hypothetical protein JR316_0005632 [Psilocybe cubensis]|uniref:Uncharacterized protein n=2 Tax=Psilocybe cubensis TaxID=181762 RepID=A0ACB8H0A2_PSICU|nr:hypothetical protein JR316_0005632 [Psilocybe cubensis]KAH9481112.1 hypothetical protein JR316_0005632 [Psilocybe cubensis]